MALATAEKGAASSLPLVRYGHGGHNPAMLNVSRLRVDWISPPRF
jgi:hypothetical protein